jgi:hypothetical protein
MYIPFTNVPVQHLFYVNNFEYIKTSATAACKLITGEIVSFENSDAVMRIELYDLFYPDPCPKSK